MPSPAPENPCSLSKSSFKLPLQPSQPLGGWCTSYKCPQAALVTLHCEHPGGRPRCPCLCAQPLVHVGSGFHCLPCVLSRAHGAGNRALQEGEGQSFLMNAIGPRGWHLCLPPSLCLEASWLPASMTLNVESPLLQASASNAWLGAS